MEYNSRRQQLILPEYGRNVTKMIETACEMEDRDQRNLMAKTIVMVMEQLTPQMKDITDYKQKLWDHMILISDFKLDVDSPYPLPSKEALHTKPKKIKYPSHNIKFRHYGKIIQNFIGQVSEQEAGPERDAVIAAIANFMKMAYLNWNRDTVSDEMILEQLRALSEGRIKVSDSFKFISTETLLKTSNASPSSASFKTSSGKH